MARSPLSWAALFLVLLLIASLAAVFLPALARAREAQTNDVSRCQNNLKQFGVIFKMYASENRGFFPPLMIQNAPHFDCATRPRKATGDFGVAVLSPKLSSIYPEYLTDPRYLCCPGATKSDRASFQRALHYGPRIKSISNDHVEYPAPDDISTVVCSQRDLGVRVADYSYNYLGFAYRLQRHVEKPLQKDEMEALRQIWRSPIVPSDAESLSTAFAPVLAALEKGEWETAEMLVQGDLTADMPSSLARLYRLREGIERQFITDVNDERAAARIVSEIWIMGDAIWDEESHFNHRPGRGIEAWLPFRREYARRDVAGGANALFMDGHVEYLRYDILGSTTMAPMIQNFRDLRRMKDF